MSRDIVGPPRGDNAPQLTIPRASARTEALVLLLHGGQPEGDLPVTGLDVALLRMLPFARDLQVRSRGRLAPAVLRHSVRGWNGAERTPVGEAEWALDELRSQFPGKPIALLGHSMGGRTALTLAEEASDQKDLAAVVALAPWLPEPIEAAPLSRFPMLFMHGQHDHITDPEASADLVNRIRAVGGDVEAEQMPDGHTMVRYALRWQREASRYLMRALLQTPSGISKSTDKNNNL